MACLPVEVLQASIDGLPSAKLGPTEMMGCRVMARRLPLRSAQALHDVCDTLKIMKREASHVEFVKTGRMHPGRGVEEMLF